MQKNFLFLFPLAASLMLSGCALPPEMNFDGELRRPRPELTGMSRAMEVASAIQTTANCLGCADTALWPDEKHLASEMGFDPKKNAEAADRRYKEALREWERKDFELRKDEKARAEHRKRRPIPPAIQPRSSTFPDGLLIADSLDGRWSNWGEAVPLGLAIDVGFWLLKPSDDEDIRKPPSNYLKAAIVLKNGVRTHKEFTDSELEPKDIEFRNAALTAAEDFVILLTKSAVDLGFKPVGDMKVSFINLGTRPDINGIWQLLENDAIGCPKIKNPDEVSHGTRFNSCRVEWAPYRQPFADHQYTWRLNKAPVPAALGGTDDTPFWVAHFGYEFLNEVPFYVDKAEHPAMTEGEYQNAFSRGLAKHLQDGQYVYVPSYLVGDGVEGVPGTWTPQVVMEKNAVHYFSVIVPEGTKALPIEPEKRK